MKLHLWTVHVVVATTEAPSSLRCWLLHEQKELRERKESSHPTFLGYASQQASHRLSSQPQSLPNSGSDFWHPTRGEWEVIVRLHSAHENEEIVLMVIWI
jgi:hypothetical protein